MTWGNKLASRPPAEPGAHRWWEVAGYQPATVDLERLGKLSPRERQILERLAAGATNA